VRSTTGFVKEGTYNPSLHRVALLTAAATFPLIFMGGLVTSHGAGMSVPDWPNSYGYNMFLFPPRLWVGGILYEHTHRLMGTVVGMLSIVLTFWAWRTESRRWVRWLATSVLCAVVFQGVLGGLRVVLVQLDLAVVHACFAQAFFCLAALAAVVTSKWWFAAEADPGSADGRRLVRAAGVTVAVIYLQLVAGALMRHYGAGLAIPDLPLAYGKVLPPVTEQGLQAVNESRVWESGLARVSLGQVWLHFAHRLGALAVAAHVAAVAVRVLRRHRGTGLAGLTCGMLALLAAQVALGVLTVLYRKPADVASAHVATGALLLVTAFVLTVRAARLYPRPLAATRTATADFAESPAPDAELAAA
jgi:cytochrome c oxidase assembly protein subunit 15